MITGVSETIKHEAKEQRGVILGMLWGTLGASLLGNILEGEGVVRANEGAIRAVEGAIATIQKQGTIRAGSSSLGSSFN